MVDVTAEAIQAELEAAGEIADSFAFAQAKGIPHARAHFTTKICRTCCRSGQPRGQSSLCWWHRAAAITCDQTGIRA